MTEFSQAMARCNEVERLMLRELMLINPICLDPDAPGSVLSDHPHLHIVPQYQNQRIGRYVLDFALFVNIPGGIEMKFNIECDGHEFHKASRDQVQHDNRRNRHLQNLGWCVVRFSGNEINASPRECMKQIERAIDAEFIKLMEASIVHGWHEMQSGAVQ